MQYQKVEIAAVDTSTLRTLSEREVTDLLLKTKAGDRHARDKLIEGNLRLVLSVVQRFSSRNENPDDLFQVGCVGLIKAVDNFDVTQNVRFSTYAVPMILGEIRRFLRDNAPMRVSRSMKDLAYHAMQTKEALTNELGREATVDEIARALGTERKKVVIALEAVVDPISLYEPIGSDGGGDSLYVVDQVGSYNDEADWIEEITLREGMKKLTEREKNLPYRRFMAGKPQMEVASELGISQAQVSRLEKTAVRRLKEG
jgi:RNA polymerase sporulation-specific sigma factor